MNPSIVEKVRAPFIEVPRNIFTDSSSSHSYDLIMGLGFRFLPGQSNFLQHELRLPSSFDRLSFISNSLGLSRSPLSALTYYSSGLRSLIADGSSKILVEVITYSNGWYGRFLVLVSLGIGCTVWYGLVPGTSLHAPDTNLFATFDSYDPFLNMDYHPIGFRRVCFVESKDVSASVTAAYAHSQPIIVKKQLSTKIGDRWLLCIDLFT